jgi:hypothetical protein
MKAGCKALTDTEVELTEEEQAELNEYHFRLETAFENEALDADPEYRDVLLDDVIGALRQQIAALRASGPRRRALKQTTQDLNAANPTGRQLRIRSLLKDMDVRWSSTFLMIDRALDLAPVRSSHCYDLVDAYARPRPS